MGVLTRNISTANKIGSDKKGQQEIYILTVSRGTVFGREKKTMFQDSHFYRLNIHSILIFQY